MRLTATGITELAAELSRDIERRVQVIGELAPGSTGRRRRAVPACRMRLIALELAKDLGDAEAEDRTEVNVISRC